MCVDFAIASPVDVADGRSVGSHVLISPVTQSDQDRVEIKPLRGQTVLVARASIDVRLAGEDVVLHQPVEAVGEPASADPE